MRPKLSLVWKYFTEINLESVQCNICLKTYSRKGRGTTSLKTHLRSAHRNAYDQFVQLDAEFKKENLAGNPNHPVLGQHKEREMCRIYESDAHSLGYEDFARVDIELREDDLKGNKRCPVYEKRVENQLFLIEESAGKNIADTNVSTDPLPSQHEDSDSQLLTLLCEIDKYNYHYVFERCKAWKVNARQLKYLEKDHVRELIPMTNLGTLAEFEYLFNVWKLRNGYIAKFETHGRSRATAKNISQNGKRALSPQLQRRTVKVKTDSYNDASSSHVLKENEYTDVRTYIDDEESQSSAASLPSPRAVQREDSCQSKQKYLLSQVIPSVLKSCQEKFKTNQSQLTEIDRSMLSTAIANYFLSRHIQVNVGTIDNLAEQIVEYFPTESKRAWHDKGHGRLYDKFYNSQRQKIKSKRRKKQSDPINTNSPIEFPDDDSMNEEPDEEMVQIQKWLKCNKCEDMDEVIGMWRNSLTYRMHQLLNKKNSLHNISSILNDWPSYTWPTGHFLLNLDFNHIYPKSEAAFLERWFIFMNKISNFLEAELKDNTNIELFTQFKTSHNKLNTDSKEATLLKLLHGVTKPSRSFDTPEGDRRYSIVESQSSVMKLIQHVSDLDSDEVQTHPCIFLVGDSILKVKRCLMVFRNIQYELSFSDAICACFQFYMIFKLEFPPASLNFWSFVSGYFFDIHTDTEPTYAVMDNIVKYLETA